MFGEQSGGILRSCFFADEVSGGTFFLISTVVIQGKENRHAVIPQFSSLVCIRLLRAVSGKSLG